MKRAIRKLPDRFSETAIDDEIVVMSLASGEFFSMTGTAREIWLLLDGQRDRAALVRDLADRFAMPGPQIEADVTAFLDQLIAAELVHSD
jgi:pyrroloquinoline quinone biosynthesis protein D